MDLWRLLIHVVSRTCDEMTGGGAVQSSAAPWQRFILLPSNRKTHHLSLSHLLFSHLAMPGSLFFSLALFLREDSASWSL